MAGGVGGEHAELARIPVLGPRPAGGVAFVDDVETVARRTGVRAGRTPQASQGHLLPGRVLVIAGKKRVDRLLGEELLRTGRHRGSLVRCPGLARKQGLALLGQAADLISAVTEIQQHGIGARLGRRAQPHGRAEAVLVVFLARQRHDRGRLAPLVVELILEIPVEHVVKDRKRRGIAGSRADNQLLAHDRLNVAQLDLAALDLVAVELLVAGKDELLDRVAGANRAVQLHVAGRLDRGVEDHVGFDPDRPGGPFALSGPLIDQPQQIVF